VPKVVDIAERRTQLTDAAARVIARSGIEAATLREVAAEAGWTTGALTHYFTDKRTLLLATFEASLASRRARRPSDASTTPAERLRASIEGVLPVDGDRRRHWLVTLTFCTHASGDDQLAAAQRDTYREFRGHVTELVIASKLATGDEAQLLSERLIASADGIAIQALFDPASWPARRQRAALEATLAPLGI
jgi:AcrR family transcriptional regulator